MLVCNGQPPIQQIINENRLLVATKHKELWTKALTFIRENLHDDEEYNIWFQPIVFESFDTAKKTLILQVPSASHSEYLEKKHLRLLAQALIPQFGKGIMLKYRITVDKQNNQSVVEEQDNEMVQARKGASQNTASKLPDVDPQLDPRMNFRNYIEGESNRFSRSIGLNVAEHPRKTTFNPMFVFGPSGCGKTHLINAIGLRAKEMYPGLRVLYVSARIFQQQYTTAITQNAVNDFIAFYQTIDMLIVDDIQEWATAEKTQLAFFHIFDFLFRQQKRIILSSDRSPSQLRGMHERLITRFACGVTAEVEKPNIQLCMDILKNKVSRDGLTIDDDVLRYIASTVNGSVRDLQGVVNSLMAHSIVENADINIKLAEKIVKRIVRLDDESAISIDMIMDTVCEMMSVQPQDINGKSRKKEFTRARQIVMYLASKMTSMPASRIGRLIGGRDHSTVIHSIRKVDKDQKNDDDLKALIANIEKEIKARNA